MFFTSIPASPVWQQADGRGTALEAEVASFSSREPARDSALLLPGADPWILPVSTVHARDAETQDAVRNKDPLVPAERRRPGRTEYDSEALIQLLRQQGADTEQAVAPARAELPDATDLHPAVGIIVSVGLSALLWALSLGVLSIWI